MVAGVERVRTKPRGPDTGLIGVWQCTFVGLVAETQCAARAATRAARLPV